MKKFKLTDKFLAQYKDKKPPFGFGVLGELVYRRTYSRIKADGTNEEWWETVQRVVQGTYNMQRTWVDQNGLGWDWAKAQDSAQEMYDRMWHMKFLPPGRGLWAMGSVITEERECFAALNNPLHEDTLFLTKEHGWVALKEVEGQDVTVLSNTKLYGRDKATAANATWVPAHVSHAEMHPCVEITYQSGMGDNYTVIASHNHRWFRKLNTRDEWSRVSTLDLRVGDWLPRTKQPKVYPVCPEGAQHGFFWGDGTRSNGELHVFAPEKQAVLATLFARREELAADHWVVRHCPLAWGEAPAEAYATDQRYLYGFLAGYFAADGSVSPSGQMRLTAAKQAALVTAKEAFASLGVRTGEVKLVSTTSNLKEDRELYSISIEIADLTEEFFLRPEHKVIYAGCPKINNDWLKITDLKPLEGTHRVLCATVPDYEQFVIEGWCLTSNCGFVSTKLLAEHPATPFCFLMDASMLGVGVGFDTLGAGTLVVKQPRSSEVSFQIPDSREGWVESVRILLNSYFRGQARVAFDYSLVRPEGEPIKGFGGLASGPEPLRQLHEDIRGLLDAQVDDLVDARLITDIMNMIGRCVVAGNVRRSAEIVLHHDPFDTDYLNLKNYAVNPERAAFGWSSNNSVIAPTGIDYSLPALNTMRNGEPGYVWLENAQKYSRMNGPADNKDAKATGCNPCQPAWAWVLTPKGLRTLGDIGPGSVIWTETGWATVVNKASSGHKPVKAYKTTAGTFYGTAEHRLISKGKKVQAQAAKAIDILVGCERSAEPVSLQDVVDGLVIGDGCLNSSTRGRKVLLHIGADDQDYFQSEIKGYIGERYSDAADETAWVVRTTLEAEEMPTIPERGIPERFVRDPRKAQGLLRGLYSANGSVIRSRVVLKTCSAGLRDQVQLLLSSLGIRSYYTTNKSKVVEFANGPYECKESYDINITGDRELFAKYIGFLQDYKTAKLTALLETPVSKYARALPKKTFAIRGVEEVSVEEVFNITVDNDVHTYWTGGLNVANCGEQTLESMELCCLVETFPHRCDDKADYLRTLKFAYLYAKTVTLGKTHWPETNRILLRNRRIGTSKSGIAQFVANNGLHTLQEWAEDGYRTLEYYDGVYSDWLCIPKSIKITSIKPSGTVSLLAGATPGMHFPEARFYIRRVRLDRKSELIAPLEAAGYKVEPDVSQPDSTVVVEIPVKIAEAVRTVDQVSMWEQLALAAFLQKHWADNQVSCTITFDPETEGHQIPHALDYYQYQLKGVSFLPRPERAAYPQMPYEAITEDTYDSLMAKLSDVAFGTINAERAEVERFCDSGRCMLPTVESPSA